MKILLDECLPKRLKHEIQSHNVLTVPEMGWAGKKNGELLQLMLGQFDVFVTVDRNLQHQQKLRELPIAFVVLVAPDNTLETLKPLVPSLLEVLQTISLGSIVEVSITDKSQS